MVSLGRTGLDVFPICLGGNVFGWTADEPASRAVLDAYADAGGNFIDTSNSYLVEHGRSETIIGRWLADRGHRERIVLATKVGGGRGPVRNLRPETIKTEAHASLERLQTDRIDLYYAHFDDPGTPLEDFLRAFDALRGRLLGLDQAAGGGGVSACERSTASGSRAMHPSPVNARLESFMCRSLQRRYTVRPVEIKDGHRYQPPAPGRAGSRPTASSLAAGLVIRRHLVLVK